MEYTRWDIRTLPNGKAELHFETNDDNDDGYAGGDNDIGRFTKITTLELALRIAGKSHIGFYGQEVEVYLDGNKI